MSQSFCPHCQADWARPWYDVCPACGHRFKARPWTESAWLIFWIICAPAIAILALGFLPHDKIAWLTEDTRQNWTILIALVGSGCASIPAGILLARRVKPTLGLRIFLSLLFIPLLAAASFCLCFFACAAVLNK